MDRQDLVTVYTVNNPAEAELIRSALETVGIDCSIGGEGQAGLTGVLTIDILVHAEDVSKARKHLRTLRHEKKERKKVQREKKAGREADKGSTGIKEMNPGTPPAEGKKRKK